MEINSNDLPVYEKENEFFGNVENLNGCPCTTEEYVVYRMLPYTWHPERKKDSFAVLESVIKI